MAENKQVTLKKLKFLVGDIVYIKTDPYQYKRMIIEIAMTPNGYMYKAQLGDEDPSIHYDIELTETQDTGLLLETRDFDKGEDDE